MSVHVRVHAKACVLQSICGGGGARSEQCSASFVDEGVHQSGGVGPETLEPIP